VKVKRILRAQDTLDLGAERRNPLGDPSIDIPRKADKPTKVGRALNGLNTDGGNGRRL
jgi:hypothetical protein